MQCLRPCVLSFSALFLKHWIQGVEEALVERQPTSKPAAIDLQTKPTCTAAVADVLANLVDAQQLQRRVEDPLAPPGLVPLSEPAHGAHSDIS